MSHEITNIDRQEGTSQAWHGLTKIIEKLTIAGCWLSQWDIVKSKLFTLDGTGKPIETDYCQLTATDNAAIHIGAPVHCDTYQPITNKAFLAIVDEALKSITGASIASVGSVCSRGRVFVSVKLDELPSFKAAGREFNPYLNFMNSHDQSAPFGVVTSNTCTVCNNTFGMNLRLIEGVRSGLNAAKENSKNGAVRIRMKHTKNVADRLENVPELIDGFLGAQAQFRAIMDTLDKEEISSRLVQPLMTGFLCAPEIGDYTKASKGDLELSTRRSNQIDRLTELHFKGAGNNGRTMADAFSAVTDYFTHESSGGEDRSRQLVSSEYGSGQTAKNRAFHAFQSPDEVKHLLNVGAAVMAAN